MRDRIDLILKDLGEVADRLEDGPLRELGVEISRANSIFVAGLGRSGLMAKAFAMRLMHLGLAPHVVGETTTPDIGEGDLLICCSRRGESGSHSHFIDMAHGVSGRVALVTASPESTNARKADLTVVLPVDRTIEAHQPLGTLFEQALLLLLDLLTTRLMRDLEVDEAAMRRKHTSLE